MKTQSAPPFIRSVCLAVAGMTLMCFNLSAATMSWAPGGLPNGSANWTDVNAWNNGSPTTWVDGSDAVFNRTTASTGQVSLVASTPVTVNSIRINLSSAATTVQQFNNTTTSPVTVTTGNFTLATGVTADFRMLLQGTNGVNLTGGGQLALSNLSNTFTGTLTVTSSILTLANNNAAFGNATNSIVLNQGVLYITHPNTVGLARNISLTGDSTFRVQQRFSAGAQSITSSGIVSGSNKLTYDNAVVAGSGTTTLSVSGNNTYSGGTVLNYSNAAITFDVGHNNAFGTQGVQIQGVSKVQMLAPITIANNVTVESSGSMILRTTASAGSYNVGTTGTLKSSFAGGTNDVTAKIRSGTNGSGSSQVLTMSFAATPDVVVSNDAGRKSDIFSLDGTGSQTFTLQLSATGIASTDLLGWINGGNWVNAVTGNTGSGALSGFYAMSYDQFLANNGGSFNAATMLGAWGVDTTGGSVWSVVNYGTNADFAVVPEPTAISMLVLSATGLLLFFRRRRA